MVEPYWKQAPTFVAPGGGRVTGYADDPIYSQATVDDKQPRYGSEAASRQGVASQMENDALAQLLIQASGRANGRADGGGSTRLFESMPNAIPGPSPVQKSSNQLPVQPAGYGPDFGVKPKYGNYVASFRPTPLLQRPAPQQQGPDGGLFGITMSPGMSQNLGGRMARAAVPGLGTPTPTGNAAIAQALIETAAAVAPPRPSYTTTPFQEERFQTTSGAQMPASMNNSRWTTGY